MSSQEGLSRLPALQSSNAVATIQQALIARQQGSVIIAEAKRSEPARLEFMTFIYSEAYKFLQLVDMDEQKIKAIAEAFAEDVIDVRDDWTREDVIVFFKSVRRRQDVDAFNVMGNKITIIKLNEMACEFDAMRGDERAKAAKDQAAKDQTADNSISKANEILSRWEAPKQIKDNKDRQANEWHRENQQEAKRLRCLVDSGEITEGEYLVMYNNFLIR